MCVCLKIGYAPMYCHQTSQMDPYGWLLYKSLHDNHIRNTQYDYYIHSYHNNCYYHYPFPSQLYYYIIICQDLGWCWDEAPKHQPSGPPLVEFRSGPTADAEVERSRRDSGLTGLVNWCPNCCKVVPSPVMWTLAYNPMNTIDITPTTPSYSTYLHQLNANELGHHLVGIRVNHIAKTAKSLSEIGNIYPPYLVGWCEA